MLTPYSGLNERIVQLDLQKNKSIKFALVAFFLCAFHSNAASKDIEISIEKPKPKEDESKEIRILGQIFTQIGMGIHDNYIGSDKVSNSDLGFGLRAGTGISWKHFMLSLNAEYLRRSVEISETPAVAFPPPATIEKYEYQYFKFQPEAAFKVNINEELEIGVTSGLGFRTKINRVASSILRCRSGT